MHTLFLLAMHTLFLPLLSFLNIQLPITFPLVLQVATCVGDSVSITVLGENSWSARNVRTHVHTPVRTPVHTHASNCQGCIAFAA